MLQPSKVIYSRDEWKKKASQRAIEIKELKKAKNRHKKQIAELKVKNISLSETHIDVKKNA